MSPLKHRSQLSAIAPAPSPPKYILGMARSGPAVWPRNRGTYPLPPLSALAVHHVYRKASSQISLSYLVIDHPIFPASHVREARQDGPVGLHRRQAADAALVEARRGRRPLLDRDPARPRRPHSVPWPPERQRYGHSGRPALARRCERHAAGRRWRCVRSAVLGMAVTVSFHLGRRFARRPFLPRPPAYRKHFHQSTGLRSDDGSSIGKAHGRRSRCPRQNVIIAPFVGAISTAFFTQDSDIEVSEQQ